MYVWSKIAFFSDGLSSKKSLISLGPPPDLITHLRIEGENQGDQIRRIFAHWVIDYLLLAFL
jgi:hypothetical protein